MLKAVQFPRFAKRCVECVLFFLFLFAFSASLSAAIVPVGPPPASIQAAIDIANPGDTVVLSAGTYVEQIQVISKSIDIVGAGMDVSIIQAPDASNPLTQYFVFGSNIWPIVMIDNQAAPTPQVVNISDLTVDGSDQQDTSTLPPPSGGFYGSPDRFFAIGYHDASGTLQNVHTTNTRQTTVFNELAGGGIINASSAVAVVCNVTSSLVDFYQRLGIDFRGATVTGNVSNTTVNRGYVLTPNTSTATPNGIQFSGGAIGSVVSSTIQSNISTVLGAAATGIIPFGGGANILLSNNTIENNDYGIAAIQNGPNLVIQNNVLNFTTTPGVNAPEGIIVQDTNGLSTITSNIMNNIPFINMEIIATTDQPFQLANNQFIGSQTGMLVTGNATAGPIITMNADSFTGTSGYYIQEVAAPNDIWPSTATVSFDGLVSGYITLAQFNQILTKIFDQHNDPALGLVLDFIPPYAPLPPINFVGVVKNDKYLNKKHLILESSWGPSASPNVVFYRIYHNGVVVAEVPAESPLIFVTCLRSRREKVQYTITAVNSVGLESTPVAIRILK